MPSRFLGRFLGGSLGKSLGKSLSESLGKLLGKQGWLGLFLVLLLVGCGVPGLNAENPTDPSIGVNPYPNLPRLEGEATVEMVVNSQAIILKLRGDAAPITAGNFVDLVQKGVYDGLSFHRVVREPQPFVVQGGDPNSLDPSFPVENLGIGGYVDPNTGVERSIPLEILPVGAEVPVYGKTLETARINAPPVLTHKRGAVAMARSQFPDSASSQFYIALADWDFLDGNYAVFGYVTEGMEAVDEIQQGDRIESIQVLEGLDHLVPPGQGQGEAKP